MYSKCCGSWWTLTTPMSVKLQAPGGRTKDMWQQLQAQQHLFDDLLLQVAATQWQPQCGKIPILFALNVLTASDCFNQKSLSGCYTWRSHSSCFECLWTGRNRGLVNLASKVSRRKISSQSRCRFAFARTWQKVKPSCCWNALSWVT